MPLPFELPESEWKEEFIRPAAGPGGQHLNRTSNAVRLTFFFRKSSVLEEEAKERLVRLAGKRISGEELVIVAKEYRSLQLNRSAARARLEALLEAALKKARKRRPTRPTRASRKKRLDTKRLHGDLKKLRSRPAADV